MEPVSRALDRALVALTILACLAAWLLFWQFGGLGLTSHDWPKEALYYDILRSALRAGALPFYMSQDAQGTSWFLAIPEIPTSPQILLLPLLGNGAYAMASCLILWAAGVVGCMLWRREHATPLLPFLWLLLLFSFNGHIVAHLTVGHSMWAAYFLSPFVILFLVRFIEGDRSTRNAVLLGLTLAAMMLQGGFHLAVYFALFVAIAGLASAGGIGFLVRAFLACGLLAAFRILPALIAFQDLDRTFMSGYPGLSTLADAFLTVRPPSSPHLGSFTEHRLGWWEYDVYVGPAGLLFLGLFGLGRLVRDRQTPPSALGLRRAGAPELGRDHLPPEPRPRARARAGAGGVPLPHRTAGLPHFRGCTLLPCRAQPGPGWCCLGRACGDGRGPAHASAGLADRPARGGTGERVATPADHAGAEPLL